MGDAGELLTDGDLPGAGGGGWGGVLRDGWQFARALAAYRPRAVGLALLLLVAASVTEAFGILMLIPILHTVGGGADGEEGRGAAAGVLEGLAGALGVELTLPAALGAFVGLTVARSVIVGQRDVLLPKIRLGFVDDLRGRLHQAVAGARWQFLAGQRRSDFQHILTGEVTRVRQATLSFLYAVTAVVLLGVQLGIAFLISPAVSAAALGVGAMLLLLTRPLVRRSQALGAQLVGVNRTVFSYVMDFVTGLKLAKVQAREQAYVDRFGDALWEARRRQTASDTATAMSQMVLSVGGALALAGLAWFAIEGARLTLPELAVVTLVFARVMTAFTSLQRNGQLFANLAPSYGYALRTLSELRGAAEVGGGDDGILRQAQDECLLGAQDECLGVEGECLGGAGLDGAGAGLDGAGAGWDGGGAGLDGAGAGLDGGGAGWDGGGAGSVVGGVRTVSDGVGMGMELKRGLAVRGVWFSYGDGGGAAALSGVSLDLRAGELTAIAGPSGAGKSTLADVLLGLLEPSAGAVLVDGVAVDDANRRRWRRSCGYVPQDPYLFHDTIRANLVWARPGAADDALWRALELAAAADFVAGLPLGLDTVVGDRGSRLSGGERQRIALARALAAEPALLVLDEATSQLDADNERLIVETLRSLRGRVTVVAVAHREAVLAAADRVVTLDAGRVVDGGAGAAGNVAAGGDGAGAARPSTSSG